MTKPGYIALAIALLAFVASNSEAATAQQAAPGASSATAPTSSPAPAKGPSASSLPSKALPGKSSEAPAGKPADWSAVRPPVKADHAALAAIDKKYQGAASITMNVEKDLKLGLLGQVRHSQGKLALSDGRLRLELEGSEKSLFVVNKKNFWAVTFPAAEFKDAAVQVIKGDITTKKGRSQNLVTMLTLGGFTKNFEAIGVQALADGQTVFYLQPKKEQVDFKRAQMTLSKDHQAVTGLRYWDERENETTFVFSGIVFGKKLQPNTLFKYTPPANADVMSY